MGNQGASNVKSEFCVFLTMTLSSVLGCKKIDLYNITNHFKQSFNYNYHFLITIKPLKWYLYAYIFINFLCQFYGPFKPK